MHPPTGVVDDESLEVRRRDSGGDPDLDHVADGPIDVLDATSAVSADGDRFDDVAVVVVAAAVRRQTAVLHQSVLPARLVLGPRRRRGGGLVGRRRWRRAALPRALRAVDGEVVEGEVDGLAGPRGDDPRVTGAVAVRRVGRHDAGDVAGPLRRHVQLVVRLAVFGRRRLHCTASITTSTSTAVSDTSQKRRNAKSVTETNKAIVDGRHHPRRATRDRRDEC